MEVRGRVVVAQAVVDNATERCERISRVRDPDHGGRDHEHRHLRPNGAR